MSAAAVIVVGRTLRAWAVRRRSTGGANGVCAGGDVFDDIGMDAVADAHSPTMASLASPELAKYVQIRVPHKYKDMFIDKHEGHKGGQGGSSEGQKRKRHEAAISCGKNTKQRARVALDTCSTPAPQGAGMLGG